MCGIAGLWGQPEGLSAERLATQGARMADALAHRGPDDQGVWSDPEAGIALTHRRLSIIDLSPSGHQPMLDESGRFVLSYNGEIYNFRELRHDLEARGHKFRGNSDTEVLLALLARDGVAQSLRQISGMFAFALWDRRDRNLVLARDRTGKKPLYYGTVGGALAFGSELKALRAIDDGALDIDRDALAQFIRYSWVPDPQSIYRGIKKLPAGSFIVVENPFSAAEASPEPFWSARDIAECGGRRPFDGSYDDALNRLEEVLGGAVRDRMVADVDVGALLSGGIDSSLVVALMSRLSDRPVRTFSVGFSEKKYDEAPFARAIADHLGTQHTEIEITPGDCLATVERLPWVYDEPFADSSQIPTLLICELARQSVTVVLSGDGGDELFTGYGSYTETLARWHNASRCPKALRAPLSTVLSGIGERAARTTPDQAFAGVARKLAKLRRRANGLAAADIVSLYAGHRDRTSEANALVPGSAPHPSLLDLPQHWPTGVSDLQSMMFLDLASYLPNDVLVKVDRASMSVGLEARSPLLDHDVAELAWSLPMEFRLQNGAGKRILRDLLARYMPRELFERPKRGFTLPISRWLAGPLRDWAQNLLDPGRIAAQGLLEPAIVTRLWHQQLQGWANERLIWNILMFQCWFDYWHIESNQQPVARLQEPITSAM